MPESMAQSEKEVRWPLCPNIYPYRNLIHMGNYEKLIIELTFNIEMHEMNAKIIRNHMIYRKANTKF